MKAFIALIGLIACGAVLAGSPAWSDLRGSFLIAKADAFAPFPRTVREALFSSQNWSPVSSTPNDCTNGGLFNGVQYVKGSDYSVGLLYDKNGVIAGIQMLIPQSVVLTPTNNLEYGNIPMYNNATYNGQHYFVLTAYLVEPSTICSTGRADSDLQSQGTGSGLWIQNGPGPASVIQVPGRRPDATATGWTENNCFPAMGYHNFHKLPQYNETQCRQMSPVFGLYNRDDDLHGFGFITVGNITNPRFEHPPATAIKLIVGESKLPPCVLDVEAREGITSIHVYFTSTPYLFVCSIWRWVGSYLNDVQGWMNQLMG